MDMQSASLAIPEVMRSGRQRQEFVRQSRSSSHIKFIQLSTQSRSAVTQALIEIASGENTAGVEGGMRVRRSIMEYLRGLRVRILINAREVESRAKLTIVKERTQSESA